MKMKARAACEPSLHFGMLVRAVVVDDQMHIEPLRPLASRWRRKLMNS